MVVDLPWIFDQLGGKKTVGVPLWKSPLDLHHSVTAGLPAGCAVYFKRHARFTNLQVCMWLGVSEKTVIRWDSEPRKPLSIGVSDRLVRTAKIVGLAEEVLEDKENARAWLSHPQPALANAIPEDLLSTDIGAKQVEEILLQMEHGFVA